VHIDHAPEFFPADLQSWFGIALIRSGVFFVSAWVYRWIGNNYVPERLPPWKISELSGFFSAGW